MEPTSSTDHGGTTLDDDQRQILLRVAAASIAHGLDEGQPLPFDPAAYPPPLLEPRATFVTLRLARELRGCIGTLEPIRPLVHDIIHNAFNAAFNDPRFAPLPRQEFDGLDVHLSILSPHEPLECEDEDDLVRKLQPGVDGLILQDGLHRGTFLPAVWESLPDPRRFIAQLKLKAGLSTTHWSDTIQFYRYTAESVP
ncbi:MAG: AmmeMemoRadiSam system protein A [Phycisphaeraceae bacterium]